MEEERVKLKDEIKDLNDDVINSLVVERDEILKSKLAYMDKLEESTRTMKEMDEERNTLQSDNEELRKILAERDSPKYDGLVAKSSDLAQSTDSGISMYLDSFKEQIEKKIDSTIDIKLNERQFLAEKIIKTKEEFAGKTTKVTTNTITNGVMNPTVITNEREGNIIIYGLEEVGDNAIDENKVKDVFDAVNMKYKPISMYRLGAKQEDKIRPLMVCLQSKEEKGDFMSKLWKLKYARDKFKRISITHDYTLEERKTIKEWVKEAKRRNMNENERYTWKVRGTPKTEMRIIKISI